MIKEGRYAGKPFVVEPLQLSPQLNSHPNDITDVCAFVCVPKITAFSSFLTTKAKAYILAYLGSAERSLI